MYRLIRSMDLSSLETSTVASPVIFVSILFAEI